MKRKLELGQHSFQIPYIFKGGAQVAQDFKAWREVKEPEQVILDLRSDLNKQLDKQNKNTRTFNTECDIWRDRPHLLVSEFVKVTEWRSSVHYLEKTN